MKHLPLILFALLIAAAPVLAQEGTVSQDSSHSSGDIFERPYIFKPGGGTAIGGYAEMNSNLLRTDGLSEGFSFEQRRFNIFIFAAISDNVRLTSELEFEHGTEEIALETALTDVLLHPALNLRAGVLLPPIGRFNAAHDSPRYNVIDRPLVSTEIIPSTLSEIGAGFFGALFPTPYDRIDYELYAVNGLGPGIILGAEGGTRLAAGKAASTFEEDNNASPAFTGRLALSPRFGGSFGISFYTGLYNTFELEGETVDDKRRVSLYALDYEYRWQRLLLRGEAAIARIDIPVDHVDDDFLAGEQAGYYLEGNYTVLKRRLQRFPQLSLELFLRYDDVDLNIGEFDRTGQNIGDRQRRLTTGIAVRPGPDTVLRLSYWRGWHDDVFDSRSDVANIQFGLATYF